MEEPGIFAKYYGRLWIVYSAAWSIALILLFLEYLYILVFPLLGCLLYLDPKTRNHGFIFLIGSVYFWVNLVLSTQVFGYAMWEFYVLIGWSMLAIEYLSKSQTFWLMMNLGMLLPILLLDLGYSIYRKRNWKLAILSIVAFVAFCSFGIEYQNACAQQYQKVSPLKGQNLPQEKLFQTAGQPVYYRNYDHRYGYYIKGEEMIAVKFYDDGTCHVSTRKSWFLD